MVNLMFVGYKSSIEDRYDKRDEKPLFIVLDIVFKLEVDIFPLD